MKKSEQKNLRRYAVDLSGFYGMQDITYNEGKAKGLRAIHMKNGRGLEATLLPDRCLDIPYFSYKGVNLGLVNKTGLCSPAYFAEEGVRGWLKQFNGGLLTTCGLTYAGAPCELNGRKYGLHGVIGNVPCTNVNKEEVEHNDALLLQVSGDVKEACVFEECVVLHRKIQLETEANVLHICDTVENCGFTPAPLINLYHINFGYPLLDADVRLYFSTPNVTPRDEIAQSGVHKYHLIEEPEVGRPEQCYIHTGGSGMQFGMLHNEKLGLAVIVHFNIDALPFFNEWKCMMAGDYALGLEPSAAGFWGLEHAQAKGILKYLPAGEATTYHIRVEVADDPDVIAAYIASCKER